MKNNKKNTNNIKWENYKITKEEAHKFGEMYINKEPIAKNGYKFTLEYELSHYGDSINENLRRNNITPKILQMTNLIANNKTKKDIVIYRGVCEAVYKQMINNTSNLNEIDLYEKGFFYSSLVEGHEIQSSYQLRVFVPIGTNALYQGNVNNDINRFEVILQRDTKLKILSIDNKYINCIIIQ